ncbi:hypothetical protein BN871_KO_00080 [Paenibacillus sp. P22]|nr:hypothetical protein BN871_KO_00080 [Paenibacillus sp. P22]
MSEAPAGILVSTRLRVPFSPARALAEPADDGASGETSGEASGSAGLSGWMEPEPPMSSPWRPHSIPHRPRCFFGIPAGRPASGSRWHGVEWMMRSRLSPG